MPPGASLLMRGLGMREIDRQHKRGRTDLRKYDRPKTSSHDRHGGNYPVPLGVHGNRNIEFPPYMTDEDIALLGDRYIDRYDGSLGGLSDDYVWRRFEFDRSQLRRQGHISPYKHVRSREARDRLEFQDWLRSQPDREMLEAILARGHNHGCVRPDSHT